MRLGRRQLAEHALQQRAGRVRTEMSALQQDVVGLDADGVAGIDVARQQVQPVGRDIERLRGIGGRFVQRLLVRARDMVLAAPEAQLAT